MAFAFTLPFYAFKLRFPAKDHYVLRPLTEAQAVRVGKSLESLALQYQDKFQKEVLHQGSAGALMDAMPGTEFEKEVLEMPFAAAKDGFSYPAFDMEVDYFYCRRGDTLWAIAPATGVEASADDAEALAQTLRNNIRIYFTKTRRLLAVQGIVSALWHESIELLRTEISLQAPAPAELDQAREEKTRQLLSDAATPLVAKRREAFGMEQELEQMTRALQYNFGRSLLIVGPNGSGKSALITEAIRLWKAAGHPGAIWETTASTLIKEMTRDTGWQYNLANLCRELTRSGDRLYVRNLMELFEVGRYAGNEVSMAEYLRNWLSRAEIFLISECTEEELHRIDLISPNYSSFFTVVRIQAPGETALESIITSKVELLAGDKKRNIEPGAVREAMVLHRRFNPYSGMPGKVIRFLESIVRAPSGQGKSSGGYLTKDTVIQYFCEETGIPARMLDEKVPLDPDELRAYFKRNVFGQDHAANIITAMLVKEKARLSNKHKPIASFLFAGPTGVGKTELAKVLAEVVFGDRNRLVRFDMSEFSGPDAIMRLTGAGDADGLLSSAVRRSPFCVLLFDEIEKGHPAFYDQLLQILGEGRLTDSRGKLVNFCSTIIILTSNIGAEVMKRRPIGMSRNQAALSDITGHYQRAVEQFFRAELVNRFDEIVPFNALDAASIRHVVRREIELLRRREGIRFRRMSLQIEDEVLEFLGEKGFDPQYGARFLQRTLRDRLVLPMAGQLSAQDVHDHLEVHIGMDSEKNEPAIRVEASPLSLELLIEELQHANMANQAANLRRYATKVEDGFAFREALSEWSWLEDMRKRSEQNFWRNSQYTSTYHALSQLKMQQETLMAEIETIENEASLIYLDEIPADLELPTRIKDWEARFAGFKRSLAAYMRPQHMECRLGIYGQNLDRVTRMYRDLFETLGAEYKAFGVWHRDAWYNEEILLPSAGPEEPPLRKRREEYLYVELDDALAPERNRPEAKDQLVGIEFRLKGELVFDLFAGENGYQLWTDEHKTEWKYFVQVQTCPEFQTPNRIHRKDFFKGNARRVVKPGQYKDTPYEIEVEEDVNAFTGLIVDKCRKRLAAAIDEAVMD